jgi:hypothetical protein
MALVLFTPPALPCNLCVNVRQTPTFRQEASAPCAKLILHGVLENARLKDSPAGAGTTDLRILEVLKSDAAALPSLRKKPGDVVVLQVYVPIEDPKDPPHYLLFCDVTVKGIDVYRSVLLGSARAAGYAKQAMALVGVESKRALPFFFRHLDDADPQIATDALMEFARASDADIGEVARTLRPETIRKWLADPKTDESRLGLYAFLLGACGTKEDAAWFQSVLGKPTARMQSAYDGILAGLIQLRPREGWELAEKMLREGKQQPLVRLAIVRMLRFYMGWKPVESRAAVHRCLSAIVAHGELIDLAAEDLRRWQMWELTDQVLALYGKKGLDAPIHRRAILRYALTCPKREAKAFVEMVRRKDADLVSEVEEGLRAFEQR